MDPEIYPPSVWPGQPEADAVASRVAHDPEQGAGDLQLAALIAGTGRSEREVRLVTQPADAANDGGPRPAVGCRPVELIPVEVSPVGPHQEPAVIVREGAP